MAVAPEIGPGLVDLDALVKSDARQFRGQRVDALCRNSAAFGHRLRRIFRREIAHCHMLKHRAMALIDRPQIGLHPLPVPRRGLAGALVDHKGLAFGILQDQSLFGALGFVDQQRRVGVAREVFQIDLARLKQAMDQRQDHQPIGAGRDAVPIVGYRIIPGADRIDPDHPRAPRL